MSNFNDHLATLKGLMATILDHLLQSATSDPMFWAAIVTAWIAFRALQQTAISNELKLLPLLTFYSKGQRFNERKFFIKNIGEGAAYSLEIEVFDLMLTDVQQIWSLKLQLGGTNVLQRDEERELEVYDFNDRTQSDTSFLTFWLAEGIKEKKNRKTITLLVTFYNSIGKKYYTLLEFGHKGLTIAMPPRRWSFKVAWVLLRRGVKNFCNITRWKIIWLFRKPYIARPEKGKEHPL